MYKILLVIFLIISICLISVIMLKPGRNSDMGISVNSNSSMSFLNSSNNFDIITRITTLLAIFFFVISLTLSNLNNKKNLEKNKWKNINLSKDIKNKKLIIKKSFMKNDDIPH